MPELRRSREIERLVEELIERLTEVVESATSARARALTEEFLQAATAEAPGAMQVHASPTLEPSRDVPPLPRRARPKRQAPAVVTKPEALAPTHTGEERRAAELAEDRRIAELARLRAILRPTVPLLPAPPVIAPPPPRPVEENDGLQALEDQIRDQLPSLPSLSLSRYTAQIAAWVGRVRLHQDSPDVERTRIASRIMFDKLRNLAWEMEAVTIEGLNLSWSTRNWARYIKDNERIAATPDSPPPLTREPDADVWATPGETDAQA